MKPFTWPGIFISIVTIFFFCAAPNNPFENTDNAKLSILLKDSKNQIISSGSVTGTVGDNITVGGLMYLRDLFETMTVTVKNYTSSGDSVLKINKDKLTSDTIWSPFLFKKSGEYSFTIDAVLNDGKTRIENGKITISSKNVMATITPPSQSLQQGNTATFSVNAIGEQPITYSWYRNKIAINGQTSPSLVLKNISTSDSGAYTCVVKDKWNDSTTTDAARLIITPIVNVNNKPIISVTGHTVILPSETFSLKVAAIDSDAGQVLSYSIEKAPAGHTFTNNVFTWKPADDFTGTDTVAFVVKDNGSPVLSDTKRVPLTVQSKIDPPAKVSGLTAVKSNSALVFKWNKSERADVYELYGSAKTENFVLVATTSEITATDNSGTFSNYYVVASNKGGFAPSSDTINTAEIAAKPQWRHNAISVTIKVGEAFSLSLADSCTGTNLTYALKEGNKGSLNGTTYNFTPGDADSGSYIAKIAATSGTLSDTLTMTVNVVKGATKPQWRHNTISAAIKVGDKLSLSLADSCTGTNITFTLKEGNKGSISGTTYSFPADADAGEYTTKIAATSGALSDTLTLTVKVVIGNRAPEFAADKPSSTFSIMENARLALPVKATDPENDVVIISVVEQKTTLKRQSSVLITSDTLSWMSAAGDSGSYDLTLKASDGKDSVIKTITITVGKVIPPSEVPLLSSPTDGASGQPVATKLLWKTARYAVSYNVQIASSKEFATIVTQDSTLKDTTKPLSGLTNGTQYFWHVRSKNSAGVVSAWSTAKSFYTIKQFTIVASGTNGKVTLDPAGGIYDSGTVVKLTAVADNGYHFVNWMNKSDWTGLTTEIPMDDSKEITAIFAKNTFTLTKHVYDGGSGCDITLDPPGEAGSSSDSRTYTPGTTVTVRPVTKSGYRFTWWGFEGSTNALMGNDIPGSFTMDADKDIGASFVEQFRLNMAAGTGGTSSCASGTGNLVDRDAQINITATANNGYQFDNWTDDAGAYIENRNSPNATVKIYGNTTVKANFIRNPTYALTVIVTDNSGCTVSGGGSNIPYNTSVSISTYHGGARVAFMGWEVTSGSENAVIANYKLENTTVTVTGDATVRANYTW